MDQIGNMIGAVTRALLDLPVGELEAAIENRPATRQDRQRTVRSVTGTDSVSPREDSGSSTDDGTEQQEGTDGQQQDGREQDVQQQDESPGTGPGAPRTRQSTPSKRSLVHG